MATRNPRKTRSRLLEIAFEEIHAHGFQGMRVDEVLRRSGLPKGAFYHHFGSKRELGYAVLEEQIKPLVTSIWIEPLTAMEDPVRELPGVLDKLGERIPAAMRTHGCPLNNLAQEMASQDEGFRQRIAQLIQHWIEALQRLLEQGQQRGFIDEQVDCHRAARFLIAVFEGCIGIFKAEGAQDQWPACRSQLASYLNTLRPAIR